MVDFPKLAKFQKITIWKTIKILKKFNFANSKNFPNFQKFTIWKTIEITKIFN